MSPGAHELLLFQAFCGKIFFHEVFELLEFLIIHDPKLRQLAGSAEANFADDPNTTLIKVRQFGELLASHVAAKAKMAS